MFPNESRNVGVEKTFERPREHLCVAYVSDVGQSRILSYCTKITHIYSLNMERFLKGFTVNWDHNQTVK